jgi:anti-sigma-K factor RskA
VTATAAPTADSSTPIWPWILVALVAVAVVAAYLARSSAMKRTAAGDGQRADAEGDRDGTL